MKGDFIVETNACALLVLGLAMFHSGYWLILLVPMPFKWWLVTCRRKP